MQKKITLICKKDWSINGEVLLFKAHSYEGHYKEDYIREGIHTFIVKNKSGRFAHFHTGSEYFDIPKSTHSLLV